MRKALANPSLQRALREATVELRTRRNRAFEIYDFKAGQTDLKARRRANLDQLEGLVDRFRQSLEAAGGIFHYAADAKAAREVIGEICRSAGAGIVTKSKSMATEEIQLNQHLERLGMEVVETDLGEYMVQRKHEHPSHLIAPAIHLTIEDWAEELGTEPNRDAIMAHARAELREKFINAAVGISGANAAIAETGTVVIVSNEGNADLTITLPRVHIAVFGIDKVVKDVDDAASLLKMLARSATGQPMSTYVNWVTGPSRSSDIGFKPVIGAHGPREMHCVVLDNGREAMRADPLMREALTCIRCGACSNACPPFMAVGGHQFGHIYSGPIGLVLTPFHHGHRVDDFPNSLCVQCNACQEICPVDIPLPRQILEHRREARKPLLKKAVLEVWASSLADPALRLGTPFSGFVPGAPARLASRPFRDQVTPGGDGEPVTIFASCLVDRVAPEQGLALEKILRRAGYRVEFPGQQWCCGLICANAGDFKLGARLSRGLTLALSGSEGPIVTPSASCFSAYVKDAIEWGADGARHDELASRMRDSTRFALELLEARPDLVRTAGDELVRVAYHDSCQSLRELGLHAEPRRLLRLAGYEVVDLPDITNCCGFGGSFSMEWPDVGARLLDWKLEALAATGCTILASDNPGCLMHISSGARSRGLDLRVAHVLELVADRLA